MTAGLTRRGPGHLAGGRADGRRSPPALPPTWWAALAGLGLGLLALGPALARGFVLTYDMVFVPEPPFTSALLGLTGGAARPVPSDAIVAVAARLVPADILQKPSCWPSSCWPAPGPRPCWPTAGRHGRGNGRRCSPAWPPGSFTPGTPTWPSGW